MGGGARALQILCLGCHSDDIEIGAAAISLAAEYPDCMFHWVVFSAIGARGVEAQRAAAQFVDSSRLKGPILKTFRDGFMPFVGAEIKTFFEELKESVSPDLIFTHNRKDAHQDHRLISGLTWNTFRDHSILEYEIPKYDGDMHSCPLVVGTCERVRLIIDTFRSQCKNTGFDRKRFTRSCGYRCECNAPSGHAEAFYYRSW
jgi:LmbE family N-acetylglucosaminyl deacetylase